MNISATHLRNNIYSILDYVIEKGGVVKVMRKGKVIKITSEQPEEKIANLKEQDCIIGDPKDLIHIDWSSEWNEIKK